MHIFWILSYILREETWRVVIHILTSVQETAAINYILIVRTRLRVIFTKLITVFFHVVIAYSMHFLFFLYDIKVIFSYFFDTCLTFCASIIGMSSRNLRPACQLHVVTFKFSSNDDY